MKPRRCAGVALVCPDLQSVFLVRRALWLPEGGTWTVPGGAVNELEGWFDGARREFREEVGFPPPKRFSDTLFYTGESHTFRTFVTCVSPGFVEMIMPVLNEECLEARWMPIREAKVAQLHSGLRRVLRSLTLCL